MLFSFHFSIRLYAKLCTKQFFFHNPFLGLSCPGSRSPRSRQQEKEPEPPKSGGSANLFSMYIFFSCMYRTGEERFQIHVVVYLSDVVQPDVTAPKYAAPEQATPQQTMPQQDARRQLHHNRLHHISYITTGFITTDCGASFDGVCTLLLCSLLWCSQMLLSLLYCILL